MSDICNLLNRFPLDKKVQRNILCLLLATSLGCLVACERIKKITGSESSSSGVVLRLHGSNTIGAEYAPSLIEAFLKKKGATGIKRIPGKPDEVTIEAVLPGESSPKQIEIKAHGSDTAVKGLANDECDIGMLSRKLKSEEVEQLSKLGDMKASGSENVIALDGIAVILNKSNPVRQMTLKQIAQIFSGEINDWSEVKPDGQSSSKSGKINVYARDDKSGTFDTFKNLVLGKEKKLIAGAKRFEDGKALANEVAADSNGIGFVGLPSIGNTTAISVYEEGVQPLRPTIATIQTREYLLYRELYFYLSQKTNNQLAREFVTFALSKDGQDVAKEVGFISQTPLEDNERKPEEEKTVASGDMPKELVEIRDSSKKFNIFYFKSGSDELDNKSLEDLDSRTGVLQDLKREVILVGFTDNVGDPAKNKELSEKRAKAVETELNKSGIKASIVKGFGQDAPIRKNDTNEGRNQNRRVEIYYR